MFHSRLMKSMSESRNLPIFVEVDLGNNPHTIARIWLGEDEITEPDVMISGIDDNGHSGFQLGNTISRGVQDNLEEVVIKKSLLVETFTLRSNSLSPFYRVVIVNDIVVYIHDMDSVWPRNPTSVELMVIDSAIFEVGQKRPEVSRDLSWIHSFGFPLSYAKYIQE